MGWQTVYSRANHGNPACQRILGTTQASLSPLFLLSMHAPSPAMYSTIDVATPLDVAARSSDQNAANDLRQICD